MKIGQLVSSLTQLDQEQDIQKIEIKDASIYITGTKNRERGWDILWKTALVFWLILLFISIVNAIAK